MSKGITTKRSRRIRVAASERVLGEWSRRIEAEYRSAALTQQLAHWLIVAGAPEWLIVDATRVTRDELAHARLSHAVAKSAGLSGPPSIVRETLSHASGSALTFEDDVTRILLEGYCLGETIAVRLFSAMRKHCDVPVAKRALDRIVRDEVRHRDFGWDALEWLMAVRPAETTRIVAAELPAMLARQRDAYAPAGLEREKALSPEDRRWGLIPGATYCAIVAEVAARDYAPRLAKLGLALAP